MLDNQQLADFFLAQLSKKDDATREAIERLLTIMMKLKLLDAHREAYEIETASLTELINIQANQVECKREIYSLPFQEIEMHLSGLHAEILETMSCKLAESTNALVKYLNEFNLYGIQAIRAWEEKLNKNIKSRSWREYATHLVKNSASAFYNYSWMGIGGNLFQWIGKKVTGEHYPTVQRVIQGVGEAGGLALTYFSSFSQLLRMVAIGILSEKLWHKVLTTKVDDENAKVEEEGVLNSARISHALRLGIACGEAYFENDYVAILENLKGIGISEGINFSTDLFKLEAENKNILKLLLSLTTPEIFRAVLAINADNQACDAIAEKMNEAQFDGVTWQKATCQSVLSWESLYHLFPSARKVDLKWQYTNAAIHSSACEFTPPYDFVCEPPTHQATLSS